jgi:hypothetical protein
MQLIYAELLHDAGLLTTFVEALPRMEIPSPGFELGGANLSSDAPALLTIRSETAEAFTHAYNRMRGANELRDQLLELVNGQSALIVRLADASAIQPDGTYRSGVGQAVEEFQVHQVTIRDALLRRLADLKPFLDKAIDAVEAELRIDLPVKAAQREFRSATPPDRG